MSHILSCAVLATSRDMLYQLGLLDVLKESALMSSNRFNKHLSSSLLCKLCYNILYTKKESIITRLNESLELYCSSNIDNIDIANYLTSLTSGELFQTDCSETRDNECNLDKSRILNGQYGRMLISNHGIGRGDVLLREQPFASVLKSQCNCHQDVILVEYVHIAWAIALLMHINSYYDNHSDDVYDSPSHSKCWQQFKSSPLTSSSKSLVQDFLLKFQSCLGNNVMSQWTGNDNNDTNHDNQSDETWSFETQCLMIVCSCLCSILTEESYSRHDSDLSPSNKSLKFDAEIMFQILSRIPTNIHAVFSIISSDITTEKLKSMNEDNNLNNGKLKTIQQKRIGFALFMSASSVNHSCLPNASVRYNFSVIPKIFSKCDNSASDDITRLYELSNQSNVIVHSDINLIQSLMSMLSTVVIEVVPTRSIMTNEEICISYGPMQGIHSYNSRQECLYTQFRFNCRCDACCQDLTDMSKQLLQSDVHVMKNIDTINKSSIFGEVSTLCVELQEFHEIIELIQFNSQELLMRYDGHKQGNNIHATVNDEIMSYCKDHLKKMNDKFLTFQARYFIESLDLEENISSTPNTNKCNTSTVDKIYPKFTPEYRLFLEYLELYIILLDIQAQLHSVIGKYLDASSFVKQVIKCMLFSGRYDRFDVIIGREKVKLAQLYFSAGEQSEAYRTINSAIKIIEPFVSVEDPDLIDAKCMLNFLKRK